MRSGVSSLSARPMSWPRGYRNAICTSAATTRMWIAIDAASDPAVLRSNGFFTRLLPVCEPDARWLLSIYARHDPPGVDARLDLRERRRDLGSRSSPTAAPACHVVGLRHRVELDRDVARAVDLEDARRHVAVVRHLGVGVVEDEQDVEIAASLH